MWRKMCLLVFIYLVVVRLVSSLTLGQEFVTYLIAPQQFSAVRGGLEKHLKHFFLSFFPSRLSSPIPKRLFFRF